MNAFDMVLVKKLNVKNLSSKLSPKRMSRND